MMGTEAKPDVSRLELDLGVGFMLVDWAHPGDITTYITQLCGVLIPNTCLGACRSRSSATGNQTRACAALLLTQFMCDI